jgi:plasmid maintenance system antidote protein VapI
MRKERAKGDRTKATPPKYADPFRSRLERWVADWVRANDETRTAAAKHLGFSQPHLSALILGRRSVGLAVILELYERTGITPNEWLGIQDRAKGAEDPSDKRIAALVLSGMRDLMAEKGGKDDATRDPPRLPPLPPSDRVRGRLQGK